MARALDAYFNAMVDHGMNASTFTARVITSTRSDRKSSIVGALGALKGPLHGGAPEPALAMLQQIGIPDRAEPFIRNVLERGERLMGFGHRGCTFAATRMAGWVAHCREQEAVDRIFRPQSEYVGCEGREWVDLGDR